MKRYKLVQCFTIGFCRKTPGPGLSLLTLCTAQQKNKCSRSCRCHKCWTITKYFVKIYRIFFFFIVNILIKEKTNHVKCNIKASRKRLPRTKSERLCALNYDSQCVTVCKVNFKDIEDRTHVKFNVCLTQWPCYAFNRLKWLFC